MRSRRGVGRWGETNKLKGEIKEISYEEEVRKEGGCACAVPVKGGDRGGLFSAAPGVNGSAGACHSEGPAWDDQR